MLKRLILAFAMTCIAASVHAGVDLSGCKPLQRSGKYPFDYNDVELRSRYLHAVTSIHFTPNVEKLIRGATSTHPYPDIAYTLNHIPNFPRALQSLQRLAAREDSDPRFKRASSEVECFFKRAIDFAPKDLVPRMIYAQYLVALEKPNLALEQLLDAEKMAPDDANLAYNIGLLMVDMKRYEEALGYAHRAYLGGFPFPGLRDKLKRAGVWREPVPAAPQQQAIAEDKPLVAAPAENTATATDLGNGSSSPQSTVANPAVAAPGKNNEPAPKP